MNTSKFLEGIIAIEKKIQQMAGENSERASFLSLILKLADSGKLESQTVTDLKELWVVRNKIYSSRTPENTVSDEAEKLLAKAMINFNSQ